MLSIFLGLICFANVDAQVFDYKALDTLPDLTLEQALKIDPLTVYKLSMKKGKLIDIPESIIQFKNLQVLNVSKNKLNHFPSIVFNFKYLQKLDVSDNKIQIVPSEIGELIYLKEFIVNQTDISTLPPEISKLNELFYLDVWGSNVASFPDDIQQLKETLKEIDMRVIMMSDIEHKKIQELLPNTKIYFSKSCNCGF